MTFSNCFDEFVQSREGEVILEKFVLGRARHRNLQRLVVELWAPTIELPLV